MRERGGGVFGGKLPHPCWKLSWIDHSCCVLKAMPSPEALISQHSWVNFLNHTCVCVCSCAMSWVWRCGDRGPVPTMCMCAWACCVHTSLPGCRCRCTYVHMLRPEQHIVCVPLWLPPALQPRDRNSQLTESLLLWLDCLTASSQACRASPFVHGVIFPVPTLWISLRESSGYWSLHNCRVPGTGSGCKHHWVSTKSLMLGAIRVWL